MIFPPVAKPSEPPAGIAVLSGALAAYNVDHTLLDANLEGMLDLLKKPFIPTDTWTRRAFRNLSKNLSSLKSPRTYQNIDTYKRAVLDINHLLNMAGGERVRISLADYHDARLSPVKSDELLYAARHPAENLFFEYFSKRLRQIIWLKSHLRECDKTTVAGFSLNYLSQALTTFAMIGFLKQEFPDVTIVLGGSLVTSWMHRNHREGLFHGLVDHCIAGPGEYQLLSLLHKKPDQGLPISPCYDSLPISDYLAPGLILPYRSAIGCYWGKCSFCPENAAVGGPLAKNTSFEQIPPERATMDLRNLVSTMKPALVHLVDNAISPALMQAICKQPPGAPWYGFARITSHLTDPAFCMALRQSGCMMLKLGLESGDQGVLDALHKGIDLETASMALQNLKKAGIATYIYLLFGTPAETRLEAQHTLDFVAHHAEEIGFMNIAIFNLPLNSPEAAGLETAGFYEGDLSLYTDFQHPHGWSRRSVREFLDTEFRRHPAIRSILRGHPPLFTSNHAPFFEGVGQ